MWRHSVSHSANFHTFPNSSSSAIARRLRYKGPFLTSWAVFQIFKDCSFPKITSCRDINLLPSNFFHKWYKEECKYDFHYAFLLITVTINFVYNKSRKNQRMKNTIEKRKTQYLCIEQRIIKAERKMILFKLLEVSNSILQN